MNLDKLVQKLGYQDYRKYLNSSHWKSVKVKLLRSKLVQRDSNGLPVCEACGANKKLHVHHRTYKTIGKERIMDLALVCELCHMYIHQYSQEKGLNLWTATKRAIKGIRKDLKKKQEIKKIDLKKLDLEAKHAKINFGDTVGLLVNPYKNRIF